jgi:hypothetical protein
MFLKRGERRAPIINRGTYTRTYAIDRCINKFIQWNHKECQVVSLGAGSDSRYFNLKVADKQPKLYVEIDYPQITSKKAMAICKNAKTKSMLNEVRIEGGGTELISADYWLLSEDLTSFDRILQRMVSMGFDTQLPTLFLSECVLVYLDPKIANSIISTTSTLSNPVFVTYEQIEPNDPFGAQMMENLKARGLSLPSIYEYPDVSSQKKRYIDGGYLCAVCHSMNSIWNGIPDTEKIRVQRLEIFDELEEWELLMGHYCLLIASKSQEFLNILVED